MTHLKTWVLAAALSLGAATTQADPGVMFGIGYNTGQGLGLSVKLLSSDRQDRFVGSVGTSFYPRSNRLGIDLGAGRTFDNGAATVSYDLLNKSPEFGVGYVNTKR